MRRSIAGVLGGMVLVFAVAGPAVAQRGEGRESARSGLWGGLGFGYGSLGCAADGCSDERSDGFSGMGVIGGTLSDYVRIGGGGAYWTREEDGVRLDISSALFMVQVFPARGNFYLQGGAGVGSAELTVGSTDARDEGGAFLVGLGWSFDLGSRGKWAIVPYANWMSTTIDFEPNLFQIGVGFFWN